MQQALDLGYHLLCVKRYYLLGKDDPPNGILWRVDEVVIRAASGTPTPNQNLQFQSGSHQKTAERKNSRRPTRKYQKMKTTAQLRAAGGTDIPADQCLQIRLDRLI